MDLKQLFQLYLSQLIEIDHAAKKAGVTDKDRMEFREATSKLFRQYVIHDDSVNNEDALLLFHQASIKIIKEYSDSLFKSVWGNQEG